MSAIQTQPLSISVDASTWHSYSSGIFSCDMSSPDIDHVVQLVGYGTETTGDDYWIVRNSWGPSWGENGFIRLARQDPTKGDKIPCGMDTTPQDGSGCEHDTKPQKVCGACGMLSDTSFPTATTTMATTK
jgi:cathepsin L